jgi:hypothetical protein
MPIFEDKIHALFDSRITTLAKIKSRSLGADSLTLTALNVLVYAQLEGGIKDLVSCVLRDINARHLTIGDIKPQLLKWRNPDEINRFKSMVDFNMIASSSPFSSALARRVKVRGIDRRNELNQMSCEAITRIYSGMGLDSSEVERLETRIDQIVDDRNSAAHHGVLPTIAASLMEKHVRENVTVVENVLTDFSLQILPFFTAGLHVR